MIRSIQNWEIREFDNWLVDLGCQMSDLKFKSDIWHPRSQNPHPPVYNLHLWWKTTLFTISFVERARINTHKSDIWHLTSEIFPILPRVNAQWNKREYQNLRYVYSFINLCGLKGIFQCYPNFKPWKNMLIRVNKPLQVNFALWG